MAMALDPIVEARCHVLDPVLAASRRSLKVNVFVSNERLIMLRYDIAGFEQA